MEAGKSYLFLRPDRSCCRTCSARPRCSSLCRRGGRKSQYRRQFTAIISSRRVEGSHLRESPAENQKSTTSEVGGRQAWRWILGAGRRDHPPGCSEQYAFPGELIIGTDPPHPNAGGFERAPSVPAAPTQPR
jgi:hypothetical protein